jgi:tRNA-5-methyluridine54 2-sulfurtransferase
MKCDICGGVAVIGMPQHRLNLCAEHFVEWVPRMVERVIRRYAMFTRDERVLVAVSGGKDSLALWEILIDLGYQTEGVYIHLGIDHDAYSDVSQEHVRRFAEDHADVPYRVVDVRQEYGLSVPELSKTGRGKRLCSACGLVKRHIMNRIAYEGGYAAIATGHNLDDEAAVLLQNTLHWQSGYLRRQAPVLPSTHPRLARKVKPLCHLYERETAAYALVKGISFVELECPHATQATTIFYKELLNKLEGRSRGAKMQFYLHFLKAKEGGLFAPEQADADSEPALRECRQCGQPTSAEELCAFCRLWQTIERHHD